MMRIINQFKRHNWEIIRIIIDLFIFFVFFISMYYCNNVCIFCILNNMFTGKIYKNKLTSV